MPFFSKIPNTTIPSFSTFIIPWLLQSFQSGSFNCGITLVAKLTSSRTTPWLKMVISISNKIFNLLLSNKSFLTFWFSVQNSLFHGYVHGFLIIISNKGIQFLCFRWEGSPTKCKEMVRIRVETTSWMVFPKGSRMGVWSS